MGVERFFSSIKDEFNVTTNTEYPYIKLTGKYLFIDFNSIVHIISAHLLKLYNLNNNNNNINSFESKLLNEIGKYLLELIKYNINSEILENIYIAIDGTPTMSKIYEQKKRRYMAKVIEYLKYKENISDTNFNWDKNNISPGTIFMNKLEKYLS